MQCTAGEIFVNEKSCIKFLAFFAKERRKKRSGEKEEKELNTGEKKEEKELDTGEKKEKEELTHRMSSSLSKSTLTWGEA